MHTDEVIDVSFLACTDCGCAESSRTADTAAHQDVTYVRSAHGQVVALEDAWEVYEGMERGNGKSDNHEPFDINPWKISLYGASPKR